MKLRESVRWTKSALFPMGRWDGQVDHIHLYRTDRFAPHPEMSWDQLEAEHIHEVRWWSSDELRRPNATFSPRPLPALLSRLHREGVPATPIELNGF